MNPSASSETAVTAFVSLGSNLGDREGFLKTAVAELDRNPGIRVTAVSSIYETEPVGYLDQDWFLNLVIRVETSLEPLELLHQLQGIEKAMGRKRMVRWGPRVIDLDLLLYDGLALTTPELELPHPRMYQRNFVMVPLNEIAPDFMHPDGRTTGEHLLRLGKEAGEVRLFREKFL